MDWIRARLTYANVISTAALFAVLGGGAYAASKIGPSDIARNAVRAKHIKRRQIKPRHLAPGAVASRQIRNGSLRAVDFRGGALPARARGVRGPAGPAGAAGPAGPRGPSDAWLAKAASVELVGETKVVEVDLPAGSFTFDAYTRLDSNETGASPRYECAVLAENEGTLVETDGFLGEAGVNLVDEWRPVALGGAFSQASPGSLALYCGISDGDAEEVRLVVTQVATIH